MDSAKWEICYNAQLRGANAILNLYFIPHKERYGNYYFKTWTAKGELAVVAPNN